MKLGEALCEADAERARLEQEVVDQKQGRLRAEAALAKYKGGEVVSSDSKEAYEQLHLVLNQLTDQEDVIKSIHASYHAKLDEIRSIVSTLDGKADTRSITMAGLQDRPMLPPSATPLQQQAVSSMMLYGRTLVLCGTTGQGKSSVIQAAMFGVGDTVSALDAMASDRTSSVTLNRHDFELSDTLKFADTRGIDADIWKAYSKGSYLHLKASTDADDIAELEVRNKVKNTVKMMREGCLPDGKLFDWHHGRPMSTGWDPEPWPAPEEAEQVHGFVLIGTLSRLGEELHVVKNGDTFTLPEPEDLSAHTPLTAHLTALREFHTDISLELGGFPCFMLLTGGDKVKLHGKYFDGKTDGSVAEDADLRVEKLTELIQNYIAPGRTFIVDTSDPKSIQARGDVAKAFHTILDGVDRRIAKDCVKEFRKAGGVATPRNPFSP